MTKKKKRSRPVIRQGQREQSGQEGLEARGGEAGGAVCFHRWGVPGAHLCSGRGAPRHLVLEGPSAMTRVGGEGTGVEVGVGRQGAECTRVKQRHAGHTALGSPPPTTAPAAPPPDWSSEPSWVAPGQQESASRCPGPQQPSHLFASQSETSDSLGPPKSTVATPTPPACGQHPPPAWSRS